MLLRISGFLPRRRCCTLLTNCRNTEWAFTTYNSNTTNGWVTYTVRTCRRWAPAVNARTSDKVSVASRRPCRYTGWEWENRPGSLVPASDTRRVHTPRPPSPPRILQAAMQWYKESLELLNNLCYRSLCLAA